MNYKLIFRLLLMIFVIVTFTSDFLYPETKKIKEENQGVLQKTSKATAKVTLPVIVELKNNVLQVGTIRINQQERFASIKGEINMSDGLVEYLACSPKGKLHESVLTLYAEPYHIQVALLLLGLVPGDRPIEFQGAQEPPCGDPVGMTISWNANEKIMEYPPEYLILNVKNKKIMNKANWVFTGSKILNGNYMAQTEGSIVATYHDPFAIIDHRNVTGTDDTLFFANRNVLPPVGTPVVFKIFAHKDPKVKKRVRCKDPI
jgi:hypothetical protein